MKQDQNCDLIFLLDSRLCGPSLALVPWLKPATPIIAPHQQLHSNRSSPSQAPTFTDILSELQNLKEASIRNHLYWAGAKFGLPNMYWADQKIQKEWFSFFKATWKDFWPLCFNLNVNSRPSKSYLGLKTTYKSEL